MVDYKSIITTDANICGGKACIRGMRIRVIDVLNLMANGLSNEEILEELPDIEREDVEACLRYAIARLDHPTIKAA